MTFRPGSAHPVAYLRVLMLAEMLRRMNFPAEAARLRGVWTKIYDPRRGHRLPAPLLQGAPRVIPEVVDEIAFQTRRNLAHRALADIIPFSAADEDSIRRAASGLESGAVQADLPARFMLSAASYALARGRTAPARLSRLVLRLLNAQRRENLTRAALSAA
jgi:hypothetical protein